MAMGISIQRQAEKGFGLLNIFIGENGCGKTKALSSLGYQDIFASYDSRVWDDFDFSLVCDRFDWIDDISVPDSPYLEMICTDRYTGKEVEMSTFYSAIPRYAYMLAIMSAYKNAKLFVDNIDCGLNPKLGGQLVVDLSTIAKKNNNQLLAIAYNPMTLDGLDLSDDDQRLYVAYRTIDGERTRFKRIYEPQSLDPDDEPLLMSEAWLNGYIGGLPHNF